MALTEAVIISGPRRGEIIALRDDQMPDLSEQDINALNEALDQLNARLEVLNHELRLAAEAFRGREESS